MYLCSKGSFRLRRSCTEVGRLATLHVESFLLGGCSSRGLGGLLRKTEVSGAMSGSRAEDTCCCSHYGCCSSGITETWLEPPKHSKCCHKKDINLASSGICVVYHGRCTYTRADYGPYLYRDLRGGHGAQKVCGGL
ncbi:unnamed protein product [Ascophyllum nodosum]